MIVSNTTISRPETMMADARAAEGGGLSGRPIFDLSTHMLAATFLRVGGQFPLVGVGGVDSVETAWSKIEAGASLVQLYSALVFKGPSLIDEIKSGLLTKLGPHDRLAEHVGRAARQWCDHKA